MTIALPPETETRLQEAARSAGQSPDAFAAALLDEALQERAARFAEDAAEEAFALDADTVQSIQHGLDDMDVGRTLSLSDAQAQTRAALTARFGTPAA